MKRYIRKTVLLALICVLLVSVGCSPQTPATEGSPAAGSEQPAESASASASSPGSGSLNPDDPVTLTLWHYYTGESQQDLEEAVSEFNQTVGQENGVIIESVPKGNLGDLETAVTDSAKGVIHSEEMPNIFSCYADKATELDELGVLCDMSTYFTQEEQDEYVSGFIEDGILDGKLLIVPIVKSTELLYVNKTALDDFVAANPDAYEESMLSTWQTLYTLSESYYNWIDAQTPDTPWDGKGFMGIDELANFLIISNKQLGVDLLDGENATVNLNKEALKTIFDVYYPASALGYFDQVGQFRSDDVKTGDLAAYVGSSSGASYFPTFTDVDNQPVDIELLATSYPIFEGGEPFAIQQGAGMAVAKTDPAREEGACLFLKWFTDVERNVPFAMETGYLPVKQAAYSSDELKKELEDLSADDPDDSSNIEQVYNIAFDTIIDGKPYAAKPFADSYSIRSMLKSTLSDAGNAGRESAQPLKAQGMSAQDILTQLDTDAQFETWLSTVRSELDEMGVKVNEA